MCRHYIIIALTGLALTCDLGTLRVDRDRDPAHALGQPGAGGEM